MALVLKITSGARAGQREEFDRAVVIAGRHTESDLKFDPTQDLDVSTRHAEFRSAGGGWTVQDLGSTNGTFVNGQRITAAQKLRSGDVVAFGEKGPRVTVEGTGEMSAGGAPATIMRASTGAPQPKTEERIAIAVAKQTSSMRKSMIGLAIVVIVVVIALGWMNYQSNAASRHAIALLQAQNDSLANLTAGKAGALDSVIKELKRQRDEMAAAIKAGGSVDQQRIEELNRRTQSVRSAAAVDWSTIREKSDAGVAFVTVRTSGDSAEEGTAFGITTGGLLVTNKHVVLDRAGKPYKDIVIKFAETKTALYCHFVSMAQGDVDIAFIQINNAGTYPIVDGIAANPSIRVGDPVMVLGFPLGSDLMGANGPNLIPKTTLGLGNVSKSQPTDLQLDAFAASGSSGSPVFNARGYVVGVVYGGNREAAGHVVFAVPGAKLIEALPAAAKSIVK